MRLAIAASVLLATALQAPAQTQTRERPSSSQSQTQRVSNQEFLNKAWNINNFEIQAGREAQNKVKDADYRDFATMIVDDHSRMNDELKSISIKGAQLPTTLDKEHEQKLQQLTSATGQKFEEKFRTQQIKGHQDALKLFRDFASKADDAELKSWAERSVAVLTRHLQRAEELRKPSGVM